jgi:protein-S-isoprenylcysteine O-methyltransferase
MYAHPLWQPDQAAILIMIYLTTELVVLYFKRSRRYSASKDQGSLKLLIPLFMLAIMFVRPVAILTPQAHLEILAQLRILAIVVFVLGLVLRWAAILYLGRFFTIDVSVTADHKVIDNGPYRFVRHPSYSGLLLMLLGIGMSTANVLALLVIMLPGIGLLYRIKVEESVLAESLGSRYREYMQKTKRLIPFVY